LFCLLFLWYKGSQVEPLARSGASPLLGVAPRSRLETLGAGMPRSANGLEALPGGGSCVPSVPRHSQYLGWR
jgi:hypothetical protein